MVMILAVPRPGFGFRPSPGRCDTHLTLNPPPIHHDQPPLPPLRTLRRHRPGAGPLRGRTRVRRALPAGQAHRPRRPRQVLGAAHPGGRARPQPRSRRLAPRQPGRGAPEVRPQPRGAKPGRTGDRPPAHRPHLRGGGRDGARHPCNGVEARRSIRAGLAVDARQLRDAEAREAAGGPDQHRGRDGGPASHLEPRSGSRRGRYGSASGR